MRSSESMLEAMISQIMAMEPISEDVRELQQRASNFTSMREYENLKAMHFSLQESIERCREIKGILA